MCASTELIVVVVGAVFVQVRLERRVEKGWIAGTDARTKYLVVESGGQTDEKRFDGYPNMHPQNIHQPAPVGLIQSCSKSAIFPWPSKSSRLGLHTRVLHDNCFNRIYLQSRDGSSDCVYFFSTNCGPR